MPDSFYNPVDVEIMENAFQTERTTEWVCYGANDGNTLVFGAEHEPPNAKHKQWREIYRGNKPDCKFAANIYRIGFERGREQN